MGFERFSPENIDLKRKDRQSLSFAMNRVHVAAGHELFRKPEYAIQMEEFKGIYTPDEIAADMRDVARLERTWALELNRKDPLIKEREIFTKKIAEVFEGLFLFNGGHWLGNATILKTTPYDDYVNGTDMVAELHNAAEPQPLALAVDVTFGTIGLADKFKKIYKEIDSNSAGSLKYFRTPKGTDHGPLRNKVPRVVVGVGQETVEDLAQLMVQRTSDSIRALHAHPIQALIREQIHMQLAVAEQYARDTGKDVAADAYAAPIADLDALHKAKQHISAGGLSKDPVHIGIMKALEARASQYSEAA